MVRYTIPTLRLIVPVVAGLIVTLQAGQLGNFRKYPIAPTDGSELTKNVTPKVPLILGTRG